MDDVEQSVQAPVAPETQSHEASEQSQQESRQERNWRAMRQKQDELERELRLQKEVNERLLTAIPKETPKQETDELDLLSDDDYLPAGQVKKLVQREKEAIVRDTMAALKQEQQKAYEAKFLDRLKEKFSDFDDVVNAETMGLLEEQDPELAQTIVDLKDPYKIGLMTYKQVKALGLETKVPQARRTREVEKKLEANGRTVQTPQAYDKRPLAQAYVMTDTEKKNLYREMTDNAARVGFSY